jgi:FlaA1/EpsC-like NDP-sugar epimerase
MPKKNKRVLIVGAGEAGREVVDEIENHPEFHLKPVGFIDDDPLKKHSRYRDVPVLGSRSTIREVVESHDVDEILIAIPSATGREIRQIISTCEKACITFKIVPGIREIITGAVSIRHIRNFQVEDLLGRESEDMDNYADLRLLAGKRILVTGAGGSIGAELCRQLAQCEPGELIIVGHGENSIHEILTELNHNFPRLRTNPFISDLKHSERVKAMMDRFAPSMVIHAAAHKHIPLMEDNPIEAAENNILTTCNLANAAVASSTSRFVFISTDKAVHPTSVMGVTKRIGELIILSKSLSRETPRFISVRFGNVIGSRGSVIPLFQKQIEMGGPLTVSHPEVRRYFMTAKEAARLVLHAGIMGKGGEIFTLDMGEPLNILQLARDLITLNGLEPGTDIPIAISSLKPGEKLDEELLSAEEHFTATTFRKLFISYPEKPSESAIGVHMQKIRSFLRDGNQKGLIRVFCELVPDYKPSALHLS